MFQMKEQVLLLRNDVKTGNLPEDDDHKAE